LTVRAAWQDAVLPRRMTTTALQTPIGIKRQKSDLTHAIKPA